MLTVARPTHCMPYAHCYKALSVPNASLLQGSLVQGIITALAMSLCCNAHCYKASSVPSLLQGSLLQGITSALCLPVLQGSLLQGITSALAMPLCCNLASVVCVIIAFTALCWSVFYTRDGLVWSVFYTQPNNAMQQCISVVLRNPSEAYGLCVP